MSGALFGTDGIRGIPGTEPLTPATVERIAHRAALELLRLSGARANGKRPRIALGRDTRGSGPALARQLARGFARNWAEWIAVQQFWKVPNARVCIDASKWTPQIMLEAASRYELVTPTRAHLLTGRRDPFPSCWRIYYGSDGRAFDRGSKVFGPSTPETPVPGRIRVTGPDGKHFNIQLYQVRWSNLMFELQLDGILSGMPGRPKFEKLPREALSDFMREKETGILTYESQMSARYPTEVRGKQKYEDLANREAHYRDCELMQLVRAAQDGLLGHLAPTMEAKES